MSKRKTERGFWVFDEEIPSREGTLSVCGDLSLASPLAYDAYVWIAQRIGSASATTCVMVDIDSAKRIAAALLEFVRAAEADELTELAT